MDTRQRLMISSNPPMIPERSSWEVIALPTPEQRPEELPFAPFQSGWQSFVLILSAVLLTIFIAWLEYATGPYLSFSVFYLVPVAACAWWGGFPHGILLALAGSVAWY